MRAASFLPLFIGYQGTPPLKGWSEVKGKLTVNWGSGGDMLQGVMNLEAARSLRETAGYPHEG